MYMYIYNADVLYIVHERCMDTYYYMCMYMYR